MPEPQDIYAHTHAPVAPGQPCQCEQQTGDALFWIAVVLGSFWLIDHLKSWIRKLKHRRVSGTVTGDSMEEKKP
ncbi:MAG: hypothetical protein GYA21_15320 [Myxococcales bacterium]|nr:hypothetical protein [Myxococcales bacterium]